ncbi:MAG: exopolysaccharide biosynthesis protein [bacterium]|nr:exopolysaccharide biosynthesis protein [bacterium]
MIDIHSHILPGLDDGSQSLEESLEMLEVAVESGTTDIVATPHSNIEYTYDREVVDAKIAELAAASHGNLRIHRGCDLHLTFDNINDAVADPARYSINGKGYLLVEFSDLLIFKNTDEIFDLLLEGGMVPVITHPERNYLLQQRLAEIERWVERGCLLQVTGQSLLGRFGKRAKRFSQTLMDRGMVHVIASDAHDPKDRSPNLAPPFEHVQKKYGQEWADTLFQENPGRMIRGELIDPRDTLQPPQTKKWFKFW